MLATMRSPAAFASGASAAVVCMAAEGQTTGLQYSIQVDEQNVGERRQHHCQNAKGNFGDSGSRALRRMSAWDHPPSAARQLERSAK